MAFAIDRRAHLGERTGQRGAPRSSAHRAGLPRRPSRYPLKVIAEDSFVDMLAEGCDSGIRYDERLEQDMVAVPLGPRAALRTTSA